MPDGGYALSGLQGYQYVIIRRPDKRSAIRRRLGRAQRNIRYPVPQAGSGTTLPTVFVTRFPDKCLSHRLQLEKLDLKRISVSVFQGVRSRSVHYFM
ncbi:hypothetical protein EAO91_21985 [Salmonella enterica]|nr:hypothetical protein EOS98_07465 [Salmonella sp. SSDFZ69]EAA9362833.1 hypothetical protein [Salmonella enterica]EAB5745478.1 hypothetical protein [Salmonella enterica subsp. enterica serovar Monschaui]EBQ9875606.1 hypothetical protein [Salmonella enterica subsp. enterica serovar Takoradi]EBS6356293.1 hypothetical protein [Salmonella enterica subsp. enterica serovar Albany]ECD0240702.1 hypothetical protein [Salmonella enterica subsp. enterica]